MIAAAYDWSGLYIGINGGGGSAHQCWEVSQIHNAGFADLSFNPALAEGCHNATGGTVGGQLGYRWQASNWVFGLEGQGNWANFTGSNVDIAFPAFTNRTRVDGFGLITGQVGYAWNNVLWYVKGGAAVTGNRYSINPNGFPETETANDTRWGGTVGTGVEIGFAPNWSVGLEYDHLFMGNRTLNTTAANGNFTTQNISQDVDMGLVRINYRFGGPVVARY